MTFTLDIRTAKEIEARRQKQWAAEVRGQRDWLLSESDHIAIRASEKKQEVPRHWYDYRQALRDVPSQPDFPDHVEWPEKPEE